MYKQGCSTFGCNILRIIVIRKVEISSNLCHLIDILVRHGSFRLIKGSAIVPMFAKCYLNICKR